MEAGQNSQMGVSWGLPWTLVGHGVPWGQGSPRLQTDPRAEGRSFCWKHSSPQQPGPFWSPKRECLRVKPRGQQNREGKETACWRHGPKPWIQLCLKPGSQNPLDFLCKPIRPPLT